MGCQQARHLRWSHRAASFAQCTQPTRPAQALRRLEISQSALVAVLVTGRLPRPGRLGRGEVVWRRDEVEALISVNDL